MASQHRIIELLTQGVGPTAAETNDLVGMGRFAGSIFSKFHGKSAGERSLDLGADASGWASRLEASLSARNAERWLSGLGLSESLLHGGWLGTYNTRSHLAGYDSFDGDRVVLKLEDEVEPEVLPAARRRRRRTSLFSAPRPGALRRTPRLGRSKGAVRAQGSEGAPLTWKGGGSIAQDSIAALEEGGLVVSDQLHGLPSPVAPRPALSHERGQGAFKRTPGRRPVSLDGLHIGAR